MLNETHFDLRLQILRIRNYTKEYLILIIIQSVIFLRFAFDRTMSIFFVHEDEMGV